MAITKNEYLEQYKKKNRATLNSGVTLLQQAAQKEKEAVDKVVDRNLEIANEDFALQAADLEDSVATARERNAVQRALNERQIKERMSRLGLSDSGYNESLTAGNENMYEKTARGITADEQSGFDTLARALRREREEQELSRASSKQQIDSTLATDVSKLYTDYEKDAETYAKDHVDYDSSLADAYTKALEDNYDDKLSAFNDPTFKKKYDKYVALYGEEAAKNMLKNLKFSKKLSPLHFLKKLFLRASC